MLNTALNIDIDAAEQQMFTSWVDQFNEWHLRLLDLFHSPAEWLSAHGKTLGGSYGSRSIVLQVLALCAAVFPGCGDLGCFSRGGRPAQKRSRGAAFRFVGGGFRWSPGSEVLAALIEDGVDGRRSADEVSGETSLCRADGG